MARKPSKTKTVKIPWSLYVEVKNEALEKDIAISEVLAEKVTMAKEYAENKAADRKEGGNNSESDFVCEVCGKVFPNKQKLQGHKLGAGHFDKNSS